MYWTGVLCSIMSNEKCHHCSIVNRYNYKLLIKKYIGLLLIKWIIYARREVHATWLKAKRHLFLNCILNRNQNYNYVFYGVFYDYLPISIRR